MIANKRAREGFFKWIYQESLLFNKNMKRFINYIKESKSEMQHVSWPTKKQTIAYTILVLLISLIISLYLGFFDFIFSKILSFII